MDYRLASGLLSAFALLSSSPSSRAAADAVTKPIASVALYDRDPDHIWNRLHRALFVRAAADGQIFGQDTLDPLLWGNTKHLLEGDSHKDALRLVGQFVREHSASLTADPLKRAILQRDLWAVIDWIARRDFEEKKKPAVAALQTRLATIIRQLALTKEQIAALPDNYWAGVKSGIFPVVFDPDKPAYLPADLFSQESDWVCLRKDYEAGGAAPVHTRAFGGRSAFIVFLRLPGGRKATLDYIERLSNFPDPWIFAPQKPDDLGAVMPHRSGPPWVNSKTPQFPAGTQLALIRQMLLIDNNGEIVPTKLTESVQLRVYLTVDNQRNGFDQRAFELKLSRAELFAKRAGGLHNVSQDERDFAIFLSHDIDPFELQDSHPNQTAAFGQNRALNCNTCHSGPGIHSVLSYSQLFSQPLLRIKFESSTPESIKESTISYKKQQANWGLLQGFWLANAIRLQ
jgi:hypothetical protein